MTDPNASAADPHAAPPDHSAAFRRRRFFNWFPLGLAYALLYMGRYNLTVAKTSLGALMTKEDFGLIFAAGTSIYAVAFLFNGPLVDRIGGRKGMITALTGSAAANAAMAIYLYGVLSDETGGSGGHMRGVLSLLYGVNMYFQSFAAVSIVKVNAHWFHVRERGGFSGIFGTMISSGIFFAFTINGLVLDLAAMIWPGSPVQWLVFAAPAVLLALILGTEIVLLRDRPGLAGFDDFDTGDASSGDTDDKPVPVFEVLKRILTNPIILTVAGVEFCTGVLRNGVMHWFPIYAKEVWVLPGSHSLRYGPLKEVLLAPVHAAMCTDQATGGWEELCKAPVKDETWTWLTVILICFGVAAVSGTLARKAAGSRRAVLVIGAALAFLAPFFPMGWGGLLFVAGVIGGNLAGWVSDLFFQSRRAPAAGGLYGTLAVCTLLMVFALGKPDTTVATSKATTADGAEGLKPGDQLKTIAGVDVESWAEVQRIVRCVEPTCEASGWDADACICKSNLDGAGASNATGAGIDVVVERDGQPVSFTLKDPKPTQRAGDQRKLSAQPELPMSPWWLGMLVFLMSLCVIGTHGLLSGTATMDFGGRKAAATAVGVIDGFVYLGTAVQSVSLGFITGKDWFWWPVFLLPFAVLGFALLTRIWNATARSGGGH